MPHFAHRTGLFKAEEGDGESLGVCVLIMVPMFVLALIIENILFRYDNGAVR